MQELLEWIRTTLPMDLDTPRMIEQKIESMLEKEKEIIKDAYIKGYTSEMINPLESIHYRNEAELYFKETFNTEE